MSSHVSTLRCHFPRPLHATKSEYPAPVLGPTVVMEPAGCNVKAAFAVFDASCGYL